MLRLEKRPNPSKTWAYMAPVLAVFATMIGGGIMFFALGKDPFEAIRTIFYDPLFSEFAWYYRPQLLVKGAPLIMIAIGLSMGFRAVFGTLAPRDNISSVRFVAQAWRWLSTRRKARSFFPP